MLFPGTFKDEILANKLDVLSLSFAVSERKVFFGGCGGNISFHIKKLGGNPLLLGFAGNDFETYEEWFKRNGIGTNHLLRSKSLPTSAAFVANDCKKNQLVLFDVGAAGVFKKEQRNKLQTHIKALKNQCRIAIISANNVTFMKDVMHWCRHFSIPYIFDPGQVTPLFTRKDLLQAIEGALGCIANEYETEFIFKKSGLRPREIAKKCAFFIETRGAAGSVLYAGSAVIKIPAEKPRRVVDPTGCGDAYRAGLLYELANSGNFSLKTIRRGAEKGARLAHRIVERIGTQF